MKSILIPLITLLSAAVTHASVSVSTSASVPTENVVTSYTSGTASGYQWRDNEVGLREVGQSFLASSSYTLDTFSIEALGNVQAGASGAAFNALIFESDSASSIGSNISTQSGNFLSSGENPINGGWVIFDLEDVALTEDKYYTIVFSWVNAGVTDQDQVFGLVGTGGGYANGTGWQSTDGSNYTVIGGDFHFAVTAVPEASESAVALAACAALLVLTVSYMRRRKQ